MTPTVPADLGPRLDAFERERRARRPVASLPAPTRPQPADARWMPRVLSDLSSDSARRTFQLEGYVIKGFITLLTGLWKAGKTTFVSHLLAAWAGAVEFVGLGILPCRVLVVSEEAQAIWSRRRDELSIGDHVSVVCRPFLGRPAQRTWEQFVGYVAAVVEADAVDVVVFDSLPNLWPVRDENAAAEVLTALSCLHQITEAGAAVVLAAHPSKGDQGEGKATRGSGAVGGFVDIIVELRRFDPERREDTRRVLTSYSRFEETPEQLVVEYDRDGGTGYRSVGSKSDAKAADRLAVLYAISPEDGSALTAAELHARWPADAEVPRPSVRTIERDLDAASEAGRVHRTGDGKRGDPHRYSIRGD